MFLPTATTSSKPTTEVPAIVRTLSRSDVQWNRRIFRAPPLVVKLQAADFSGLSAPTKLDARKSA
jgi:hypothetical protein